MVVTFFHLTARHAISIIRDKHIMRPCAAVLILCMCLVPQTAAVVGQQPTYTLSGGPYIVENLGPIIENASIQQTALFRLSNGETHVLLFFRSPTNSNQDDGTLPLQILDVNLDTADYKLVDTSTTLGNVSTILLYPSDKLYVCTNDPAYFIEYDPLAGVAREIAEFSDKRGQSTIIGDDGIIYIGGGIKGHVDSYDPRTGMYRRYGIMDDPGGSSYYRYAYTLGADERFVYAGIGQQLWYLVVYDRLSQQQTTYFKEDGVFGTVFQGADNKWYYKRQSNEENWRKWYRLENGSPIEIQEAYVPPPRTPSLDGHDAINDILHFEEQGYIVNLDQAIPNSINGSTVVIKWRRADSTDWQSVEVSNVYITPGKIRQMEPDPEYADSLIGWIDGYGPVFRYKPATGETIFLGTSVVTSIYDALFAGEKWYFGGYPTTIIQYDPQRAWTLNDTNPDSYNSTLNPHHVASFGKYNYYLAVDANGMIFSGVHQERNNTGGELGWYDPQTGESDSLRDPFERYDPTALISVLDGTKIIYGGYSLDGLDGKIFVLDPVTQVIEREIIPLPGESDPGKLIEIAPGIVFGISSSANLYYTLDVTSGEIRFVEPINGQVFDGVKSPIGRITLGPDGYVWLTIDSYLSRINPITGVIEKVVGLPSQCNVVFYETDAYLYAIGLPNYGNLYRIKNLFSVSTS